MEESTALAIATNTNVVEVSMAGALGVDSSWQPKASAIQLIQPISATDDRRAGRFYDKEGGEEYTEIPLVVLGFQNGRSWFTPGAELGTKPACRSIDGIVPVLNDEHCTPQATKCGEKNCPKAVWGKAFVKGAVKRIKPECSETVRIKFLNLKTGFVNVLNIKRSSLSAVRAYKSALIKKVTGRQMHKLPANHLQFYTTLSAIRVTKGSYTYYELVFASPQFLDDAAIEATGGFGMFETAAQLEERLYGAFDFYVNRKSFDEDDDGEYEEDSTVAKAAAVDAAIDNKVVEPQYIDA